MSEELEICLDHLNFTLDNCPDCNLEVDEYGNTEDSFEYCAFPNCGCDGSRLCMAPSGASSDSQQGNVEGMWNSRGNKEARAAILYTMGLVKNE